MKTIIDIENWKGKRHYMWFKEYAHPYYNINTRIDITNFYHYIKSKKLPFFVSLMYIVTKAVNQIEEFRLRMEGDNVVLYDKVSPAFTMMMDDGVYENCDVEFDEFNIYLKNVLKNIDDTKKCVVKTPDSYFEQNRNDQIYITSLPWIDFLGVTHPMTNDRTDSIPRIGWGKYVFENDKVMITFNIQVNHALVDGYPLSQALLKIQEMVNEASLHLNCDK